MRKVVLFCAGGMSTSLLVTKIKNAANAKGIELDINAYGLNEISKRAVDADVLLLGPQVRFQLNEIKEKYPTIPSDSIEMRAYGTMDGEKVLQQIITLLGDIEEIK